MVTQRISDLDAYYSQKANVERQLKKIQEDSVRMNLEAQLKVIDDNIRERENKLRRILQKLKEQEARSGINTDPEILIDIEDIEKYFGIRLLVIMLRP